MSARTPAARPAAGPGAGRPLVAAACPKSMRWGPCGGVRPDGGCEVGGFRCPFLDRPVLGPEVAVGQPPTLPWPRPWILVDVRETSRADAGAERRWSRTAAGLSGAVALVGEHVEDAHDDAGRLPLAAVTAVLADAGVPAIVTVTGRGRDRLAAARRLRELRAAGVAAVHAVTGDHPRSVPEAQPPTWGVEGTSLAALASSMHIPVTVAESPGVPGDRQARLEVKRAHGAAAAILNHAGPPDVLVAFADEHRRRCTGDRHRPDPLPLIAPVPMVCDEDVARRLSALPGVVLPPGLVEALRTADRSTRVAAAVRRAADHAAELAATGRFAGIDLSGDPGGRSGEERADRTAEFVAAVRRAVSRAG